MTNNYVLQLPTPLVRDSIDPYLDIGALVASGDCFVTLASMLDGDHTKAAQQQNIERVIRALLQLQREYQIVKKRPDYRQ